ncbi:MAG: glycine--tRNA ligase [Candidatus Omnitrophota bacterium]|nr:MAG: glycine--tRNA ligase [Candidatus Omnitrophota bacterium]
MPEEKLSKIVSLCRRRGFIFGGSEIYGGLSSIWDYGPLGAIVKKRIKDIWWNEYVEKREDIVGLDSAIIMHQDVFVASGHLEGFVDFLLDCPQCKKRERLDKLEKIDKVTYRCSNCGFCIDTSKYRPRKFNLMLKTNISATEDQPQIAYLRPETAQGIFTNFINVINTTHKKLPFGIAQIGKAFRNEVTGGNFIFRMKEFEQMEIEYFTKPEEAEKFYHWWVEGRYNFYIDKVGIKKENLRLRQHSKDELAHYARACTDVEYNFPFGWSELEGIADRGDYDLTRHSQVSKKDFYYYDDQTGKKFIPYVIEPSAGVDRTFFAVICDAYTEEIVKGRVRVVLKIHPRLAPYKVAIFPLLKNKPQLVELAKKIFYDIKDKMAAVYDDTAAIGKLYRRQDEIGTPFCVTVDVESLSDRKVTIRDRDSMVQQRVEIDRVYEYLRERLELT